MSLAMRGLARPQAADDVVAVVRRVVGELFGCRSG
jgi:hypothetical protein